MRGMAHVSHRLKGALEGALAGGGDPATSPLYVFGPFLRLLATSGAGAVAFGAPIWMVVTTVVVVSLMYRHVMRWIPDGSGGSGLCEEEFGSWAVKVNASITFIEYTLTFLVSIAALVTFVMDRVEGLGGLERTGLAVGLTLLVGAVVNRGPRLAARVFGPATAAVLLLLWVLIFAVLFSGKARLPGFDWEAFSAARVHTTLAGYVRLLALMTGIEVFANLVAAYDGSPEERAGKAFKSLLIVMVSTLATMVVVGPAIYSLANVHDEHVSVFTQTMDQLLPAPLAYAGTLVGIVVLLSAAAAAAQGVQNLSLGMRQRHYVPALFGQRNRYDVADRPIFIQVALVTACFVAFGTHEETYLALYAAGVFVLLGLTGWAAVKRLVRLARRGEASKLTLLGTTMAALVTSGAAALIFEERFTEGAWAYLLFVPVLYSIFSSYRARLGAPGDLAERVGRVLAEKKSFVSPPSLDWPGSVLVVLDGSEKSDGALVAGAAISAVFETQARICCVGVSNDEQYGRSLALAFPSAGVIEHAVDAKAVASTASRLDTDLVVVSRNAEGASILANGELPILLLPAEGPAVTRFPGFERALVALDGSQAAEACLPHAARLLALGVELWLLLVPDGGATEAMLRHYGERIAERLRVNGHVEVVVGGSGPARTVVAQAEELSADLVIVGSSGGGGSNRPRRRSLGSVPTRLLDDLKCPLLIVPVSSAGES